MSDSTSLTCKSATLNIYKYIELSFCTCCCKWLLNDELQCIKTEILIHVFLINSYLTSSWYKVNSCDTAFSSTCSVKSITILSHERFLPY